jgi:hypothetical protein
MGAEYRQTTGRVLVVLSIATFFGAAHQMLTVTMIGLNRHRVLMPLFLGEALGNLVISVLLARPLGVVGVAIGTMVPRLFVTMVLEPPIAQTELAIRRRTYFVEAWARPAMAMIGFAAATFLIERFWPARSLPVYFFQILLVVPIAAAGSWLASLDEDERQWARAKVAALLRGGRRIPTPS